MKGNRRTDTKPEIAVRSALHRKGLRFRKDYPIQVEGGRIRADIVFPRSRLAIFIDGCFWHLCPEHGRLPGGRNAAYWKRKLEGNRRRDRENLVRLERAGWSVLRIWEHEDVESAVAQVISQLDCTDAV